MFIGVAVNDVMGRVDSPGAPTMTPVAGWRAGSAAAHPVRSLGGRSRGPRATWHLRSLPIRSSRRWPPSPVPSIGSVVCLRGRQQAACVLPAGTGRHQGGHRPYTALWQNSGGSNLSRKSLVRLDLRYVDSWSPMLDLRVLVRAARAVLKANGAY